MSAGFKLATDENVEIWLNKALLRRFPKLDLERVIDVGLGNTPDPLILEWAATEDRILLTHDAATMKDFAWDRVRTGLPMPGLLIFQTTDPIGPLVDELELILTCSEPDDWRDQVVFLPLK